MDVFDEDVFDETTYPSIGNQKYKSDGEFFEEVLLSDSASIKTSTNSNKGPTKVKIRPSSSVSGTNDMIRFSPSRLFLLWLTCTLFHYIY